MSRLQKNMAIRFRIADTARGNMEAMRYATRRRAVLLMAAIMIGSLTMLWITKVLIAPPPEPEFIVYVPSEEVIEQTVQEVKDISGGEPPPAPPIAPIIVASASVATPSFTMDMDMPELEMDSSSMLNAATGEAGLGKGIGSGSANGGMGGKKMDSCFAGLFWDFKKQADGKDSALSDRNANLPTLSLESRFFNKGWDMSLFNPYFRAKQQLFSTCFYMPNCKDTEASHAFDPSGKAGLKSARWAVLYRAKVKAPASGKFRFVGIADSTMAVRFNGENVFVCGMHDLANDSFNEWIVGNSKSQEGREIIAYDSCERWNEQMGGFVAGDVFTVKRGEWYEMQVLISDIGGQEFGFCLLIDDVDAPKKRTKDGKPLFQLFRTAFSAPTAAAAYEEIQFKPDDDESRTDPPYDPDSMIWEAKPQGAEVKMK